MTKPTSNCGAQIKRAGDWRIGLRRQILNGWNNLGRDQQTVPLQMAVTPRIIISDDESYYSQDFGGGLWDADNDRLNELTNSWGYIEGFGRVAGRLSDTRFSSFGASEHAGVTVDFDTAFALGRPTGGKEFGFNLGDEVQLGISLKAESAAGERPAVISSTEVQASVDYRVRRAGRKWISPVRPAGRYAENWLSVEVSVVVDPSSHSIPNCRQIF